MSTTTENDEQTMSTTILFSGEPYELIERDKRNASELAVMTGYSLKMVCQMKAAGCPFFGRFSSLQILRKWEYLNKDWRKLKENSSN